MILWRRVICIHLDADARIIHRHCIIQPGSLSAKLPGLYWEHSAQVASFIIPSSHYQPSPPTEETQWLSLAGNHSRTMYFTVSSFHFHPFVRSICIQRNGSYLKVFGWMVLLFSFLLLIQGNVAVLYLASGEKLGYWTEKRQEILLWIQTKLSRT